MFSVSNDKRKRDAENPLLPIISLLSDHSRVFAVNTVKCKGTHQINLFPVLFVLSGSICVVSVTNVNCKNAGNTTIWVFLLSLMLYAKHASSTMPLYFLNLFRNMTIVTVIIFELLKIHRFSQCFYYSVICASFPSVIS